MCFNGRRFLYGGSIGLYHRGPLSPRWKSVTQKPEHSFVHPSLLPPTQPLHISASISLCLWEQLHRSRWLTGFRAPTWLLLFLWQLRKEARTEGRKRRSWSLFVCFAPERKWHHCWSHLFIHPVVSELRRHITEFMFPGRCDWCAGDP